MNIQPTDLIYGGSIVGLVALIIWVIMSARRKTPHTIPASTRPVDVRRPAGVVVPSASPATVTTSSSSTQKVSSVKIEKFGKGKRLGTPKKRKPVPRKLNGSRKK